MGLRYRNTPLVEAVFEFVPASSTLTKDIVERLQARFGREYPKLERLPGVEVQLKLDPAGPSAMPTGKQRDRYRLWNAAKSRLLQFAEDMCAFNALAPYSHYEEYLPDIKQFFDAYALECKATDLRHLGQRYVNRIFLPSEEAAAEDYLTLYPALPRGAIPIARHPPVSLQVGTQQLSRGQVTISLHYAGKDGLRPVYFLDLYAHWTDNLKSDFSWTSVKTWQDEAHEAVKRAFEAAITERCRKLLGREE
jgi:uncharacterized protein (TIGR04255 family)